MPQPCTRCLLFSFLQGNIWLESLHTSEKFGLKCSSKLIFVMDTNGTLNFREIRIHIHLYFMAQFQPRCKSKILRCCRLNPSTELPASHRVCYIKPNIHFYHLRITFWILFQFRLNILIRKLIFCNSTFHLTRTERHDSA